MKHLDVFWGKSPQYAGGRKNLLLSHLLDTGAVAEQMWSFYLAPVVKRDLSAIVGGDEDRACRFFAWLCGIHDIGKATPAFQRKDAVCAAVVRAAGLAWDEHSLARGAMRHDRAGGALLRRLLPQAGWSEEHVEWLWPIIAGHHGTFPGVRQLADRTRRMLGSGREWPAAQEALLEVFTHALGFSSVADVAPIAVPSKALQLQLSGLMVMADWIASDGEHFEGIDDLDTVSMSGARERAGDAWKALGLRGGWGRLAPPPGFEVRFDEPPRASQRLVIDAAQRMPGPGLLIVEAPTGEGKTKAALYGAEVLAARFGFDGVFVGMPTQATCDPIFAQLREWVSEIAPDLASQVALLHGKRRFNKLWKKLAEGQDRGAAGDFWGGVDEYGMYDEGCDPSDRRLPSEWFLGRYRGLLCPFVVGTIDQLLFAATRTKFVMLRMAGLLGKVVILDEVHAADVYMSQFLKEGLRWLGQAGVPVILLSATLPAEQRRELVTAYLSGAAGTVSVDLSRLPEPGGYPNVTAAWAGAEGPEFLVGNCSSWRDDLPVEVEVLAEHPAKRDDPHHNDALVAALLADRLHDGGCALVIRNTVVRAQATFDMLRSRFHDDVQLLHGRLDAGDRAEHTEKALDLLGPPGESTTRPRRLIIVATAVAEQSFDIDADLLITDLAPIDLLIQRIGRLHRFNLALRPGELTVPRVVVTGLAFHHDRAPWIDPGAVSIYGEYLLMRTAALLPAAGNRCWDLPSMVPALVADVYGGADIVPARWQGQEAAAFADWDTRQRQRIGNAEPFVLTRRGEELQVTLEGLHMRAVDAKAEREFEAVVRDGGRSVEVVMVLRDDAGYRTLGGRWLGVNGEASPDLIDEVLGATVRLPKGLTEAAERELSPLDGWRGDPWLGYQPALVLDAHRTAVLGGKKVSYDDKYGLTVTAVN